jgi:hypothetical protein
MENILLELYWYSVVYALEGGGQEMNIEFT